MAVTSPNPNPPPPKPIPSLRPNVMSHIRCPWSRVGQFNDESAIRSVVPAVVCGIPEEEKKKIPLGYWAPLCVLFIYLYSNEEGKHRRASRSVNLANNYFHGRSVRRSNSCIPYGFFSAVSQWRSLTVIKYNGSYDVFLNFILGPMTIFFRLIINYIYLGPMTLTSMQSLLMF